MARLKAPGTVNVTGQLTKSYTISGGALNLNAANAFTGGLLLTIKGGTTDLSQANNWTGGFTQSAGGNVTLTLGNNSSLGTGAVSWGATGQTITIQASSAINVSNNITFTGATNNSFITISGSHALTLSGDFITNGSVNAFHQLLVNNTALTSFTGGNIYLASVINRTKTFTIQGSGNVTIGDVVANSATVTGVTGSLAFTGSGAYVLSNNNTYTGLTTMNNANGSLAISGSNSGGGGVTLTAGALFINNANALGIGTLTITSGTIDNTTVGAITNAQTNTVTDAGNFTFGGTQNLDLGAGAVSLGIASSGTRTITLNGSGSALAFDGAVTAQNNVAGNGTLAVNGAGNTLVLGSLVTNTNTTARTFTINGSGNVTVTGSVSGGNAADPLTYNGTGTLTLSGSSAYTGATTVSSGTLVVNGSISASSGITVSAGATLGGSGHVSAITGAGTVAPGNSPGILTGSSAMLGTGGNSFSFELTLRNTLPTWGKRDCQRQRRPAFDESQHAFDWNRCQFKQCLQHLFDGGVQRCFDSRRRLYGRHFHGQSERFRLLADQRCVQLLRVGYRRRNQLQREQLRRGDTGNSFGIDGPDYFHSRFCGRFSDQRLLGGVYGDPRAGHMGDDTFRIWNASWVPKVAQTSGGDLMRGATVT